MDKSDNAQALKVCKGVFGYISHRMRSLWGLTEQECDVGLSVRGASNMAGFSHTQMLMLCIVDRYDELSIPNRESGLIIYHGVGFLRFSQDIYDAVDLFKELGHSTVCSLCKSMLTQGNFANEVAIAVVLREDKGL